MAINKKLIHFLTEANFNKLLADGNILDTSICFIKDANKIWTHGLFYAGNSDSNIEAVDTSEVIDEINNIPNVKYTVQNLTDSQKNQVISNIGAYKKPNEGIPKEDLNEEVQNLLNSGLTDPALSPTSTNPVQNKVLYNVLLEKANAIPIVNHTELSYELSPNILHVWGVVSTLKITLLEITDTSKVYEYMFLFESGNNPTMLILPTLIKFINTPTIEANMIYLVSIVNNVGLIGGVPNV